MLNQNQTLLFSIVSRILRPLAKLLLQRGFSYGAFAESAKQAFVTSAEQDFALPGKRQTASRISTITGLSRKEVHRIMNQPNTEQHENERQLNRTARVISGWISDERFCLDNQPLSLPFDGRNSFSELVKDYSGDITPRTIADEMTRLGAIELTTKGDIKLLTHAYIPSKSDDEKLSMLATDVKDLINTISHNIETENEQERRFHRKVYYDNIPLDDVPELKAFITERAQKCLEEINIKLAKHDLDNHPRPKQSQRTKVGLVVHYIEETL